MFQLIEQLPSKQSVVGSNPTESPCRCGGIGGRAGFRFQCLYDVEVQVSATLSEYQR